MSVYHFTPRSRNRLDRQVKRQSGSGNVVRFRHAQAPDAAQAFEDLTAAIVMERHRRGELEPEVLAALLRGCGFNVEVPI